MGEDDYRFNIVDRQRPTTEVIQLWRLAKKLNFRDDVEYWEDLLDWRGVDVRELKP